MSERQELLDAYYWRSGPCCAGCDFWRHVNSMVGECRRSAPVGGGERAAMLGLTSASLDLGAGHALTTRDHWCGEFQDTFAWSALPIGYLARIGASPITSKGGDDG